MSFILNGNGDCQVGYTGSGLGSCDITDFGDLKGLLLFRKGWSKDVTDGNVNYTFKDYQDDVKNKQVFPYIGRYGFTQDTPDNETNTSDTGVTSSIRPGKPMFSISFTKGGCLHKSLYNKIAPNGGIWDYGFIFDNGILLAYNRDESKLKAFDGGYFDVETFKFLQATDPQMSTAKMQLVDAEEFNLRHTLIPFTAIGDVDTYEGVVETKITVDAITAGDTLSASIVSKCNTESPILDLADLNNFALLGTQASATAISAVVYNATSGKYDFTVDTPLVATDTVQIKLNDGTYDVAVDSLGGLYAGASNTVTVS